MALEKIQPWKFGWVRKPWIEDSSVEYGAKKGMEIIMDGAGGDSPPPPKSPTTGTIQTDGQDYSSKLSSNPGSKHDEPEGAPQLGHDTTTLSTTSQSVEAGKTVEIQNSTTTTTE